MSQCKQQQTCLSLTLATQIEDKVQSYNSVHKWLDIGPVVLSAAHIVEIQFTT